jgi:PhnB protein
MQIQPYLYFGGRCEEAMAFYAKALDAKTTFMMRFKEQPPGQAPEGACASLPQGWEDKVMHANMQIGDAQLMVSDGTPGSTEQKFAGFSLSINAANKADAERWFQALSEGGQVMMPLQKTFWTEAFGMVQDKFGVPWMVNVVESTIH